MNEINYLVINNSRLVKSRHTREGGYPWTIQILKKNGFPIKEFGNDSSNRLFT